MVKDHNERSSEYFTDASKQQKRNMMMDLMTILEGLGDDPSSHDLDSVISLRVEEYLTTDISSYDYELRESIPQYHNTKLCFGRFIHTDIFEVTAAVDEHDRSLSKVKDDLKSSTNDNDLGRLIEAKFRNNDLKRGEQKDDYTGRITDDLDNYFNRVKVEVDNTDNDKYINSLFSVETLLVKRSWCPLSR
jgi:hypothetical protein